MPGVEMLGGGIIDRGTAVSELCSKREVAHLPPISFLFRPSSRRQHLAVAALPLSRCSDTGDGMIIFTSTKATCGWRFTRQRPAGPNRSPSLDFSLTMLG